VPAGADQFRTPGVAGAYRRVSVQMLAAAIDASANVCRLQTGGIDHLRPLRDLGRVL